MHRLHQLNKISAVAMPPRLQSLRTMKRLWSEYSSLLVRSKIGMTEDAKADSGIAQVVEPTRQLSRVEIIQSKWRNEARSIQFDFEFKAVEEERRRVAKELHDEILPSLARLARSLQTCGSPVQPLVGAIHRANDSFRDLLGELHPVDLEEVGLVDALSNICKRCARNADRVIAFVEHSTDCKLSPLQQLCVYRVIQSLLRMFNDSHNDILTVTYKKEDGATIIVVRCADKLVDSAEWITAARADFASFESWCALAGATVAFNFFDGGDQFPSDVLIKIPDETEIVGTTDEPPTDSNDLAQIRLAELHEILITAKAEWSRLIDRDRQLFECLAIKSERKNISVEIDRLILPRLQAITELANALPDVIVRQDIISRMTVIHAGLSAVMSELHARMIEKTGLVESIEILVARFRRASLIDSAVVSSEDGSGMAVSQDAKFAIYRAAQEALNNIEKHSRATRALVTIEHSKTELIISIEDNGKGLKESATTLSRGLRNIRERATAIGASVEWQSAASFPSGTLVRIKLITCTSS